MGKKKLLIPVLIGVLAAALVLVFFLTREEQLPAPEALGTASATQDPTATALPNQTMGIDLTEPVPEASTTIVQTLPEETVPDDQEPGETVPEQTEPVYDSVQFPVELEDGMLTVHSLFQFSGMNPDAGDLFGEDIAGVHLTNNSEDHMAVAEVTAVLADGTTLTFRAEDVPPGRTVMAFCLEHETVTDTAACEELFGYAEFVSGDPMNRELVEITVTGTEITVKNVSGEELEDLDLICHGLLDGSFYGGTTYHYNVSTLPAGASTVVHAVDCFLGMAEVVRVEADG